uniref:ARID domain-containing protein n=1 Tax=Leersia perrieri TaxID=77586 RepID=A0A0D9XG86_9ORYZ
MEANAAAAAAMADEKLYPPALLSHEEVAGNRAAFMDTLRRFHSLMGTKFIRIPVIGGKELDLHTLYVEVTSRGGIAKVMEERRWREVMAQFRFSPTTTSASYVMRRYYLSLLYHYEQVYFFRAHGAVLPPSASAMMRTPRRTVTRSSDHPPPPPPPPEKTMAPPERLAGVMMISNSSIAGWIAEACNFSVTGTIDGKFDGGYFVTVNIAAETLRGVLYRVAVPPPPPPVTPRNGGGGGRRRRGRKQRDPGQPKPSRSGYNFFFKEKHTELKMTHPNMERDYTKMIGEAWNRLDHDDKLVYYRCSGKDKERYKREMREYNERIKLGPSSTMAGSGSYQTLLRFTLLPHFPWMVKLVSLQELLRLPCGASGAGGELILGALTVSSVADPSKSHHHEKPDLGSPLVTHQFQCPVPQFLQLAPCCPVVIEQKLGQFSVAARID